MEHPKFVGHVTPIEDEYEKSVRLNSDTVLEYQKQKYTLLPDVPKWDQGRRSIIDVKCLLVQRHSGYK